MSAEVQWTNGQLKEAGLTKRKVAALAKKLFACSQAMQEMGLELYGCDGSGHLIHSSRPTHKSLPGGGNEADLGSVVAYVGQGFGGGGW